MPASLRMTPVDGAQKVSIINAGEEEQVVLSVASDPDILLKDTTIHKGQIHTSSHVLILGNLVARKAGFTSVAPNIEDKAETFIPVDAPNIKLDENLEKYTGAFLVKPLTQTIYQDYYISNNCFQFPTDYGTDPVLIVPGMSWQEDTRRIVGDIQSVTWEEKPITVMGADGEITTACYPGWESWTQGFITQAGYEQKPLKSNYITNTKKESKDA